MIWVVYKKGIPFGIRNDGGFLIFFRKLPKYPKQEKRYADELRELRALAGVLLDSMRQRENEWRLR